MGLLGESDKREIRKAFDELTRPVRMVLFTARSEQDEPDESEPDQIARTLMAEVAELSPKLSLELKDAAADAELAKSYGIDKSPGMVVLVEGDKDYGLRYFGVPAGHEFAGFLENLIQVSRGEHGLSEKILDELAKVDQPMRLEVLFTPS